MKTLSRFASLLLCCTLASPVLAIAQAKPDAPPVGSKVPPAQTYAKLLGNFENEIVGAAEAMPEDKFNFAPTQGEYKGVRTFAEQVKHIARVQLLLLGLIRGDR